MNGWGWVIAGYGVAAAGVAAYAWLITVRRTRLERRIDRG